MKKYSVTYHETYEENYEVEANSPEEAELHHVHLPLLKK